MAHTWNIDSFRCDCPFCAQTPAAERKGEPAQHPLTWHQPVAANRHHLVLRRCFSQDKLDAWLARHAVAQNPWFGGLQVVKPDYEGDSDADPDDADCPSMSLYDDNDVERLVHRGVIVNCRREIFGERFLGRVCGMAWQFGGDRGHIYFELEILAKLNDHEDTWDWAPYLWGGGSWLDRTILSEAMVVDGAASYKREFYDHVRLNMMGMRKLVDQKRAAPPGYLLIKGEFVKPRRTSRATTSVDAKIVSGLFDRTTLPDVCFKHIVSYMGSLEPRRPWRDPATRANWKRGDVLT